MQATRPFPHLHLPRGFSHAHLLLSVLVVAFLGFINPVACLLHCWLSSHAGHAITQVQPASSQAHHEPSHRMEPEPPAAESPLPSIPSCGPMHHTTWSLTIAVLFSLPWLGLPFHPGMLQIVSSLFLRLMALAPPLRPPRVTLVVSLLERPAIV